MPRAQLIGMAAIAIVALTIGVVATVHRLGKESAEADITKTNLEAQDEADKASSIFERCIDDGGLFDFASGKWQVSRALIALSAMSCLAHKA